MGRDMERLRQRKTRDRETGRQRYRERNGDINTKM